MCNAIRPQQVNRRQNSQCLDERLCYVPLSDGFLLIGTASLAYYSRGSHALPPDLKADQVFPYFLQTGLPLGIRGLLLAAVCSSAMDSNLNCCATLYLCDIHLRYFRPRAGEREKTAGAAGHDSDHRAAGDGGGPLNDEREDAARSLVEKPEHLQRRNARSVFTGTLRSAGDTASRLVRHGGRSGHDSLDHASPTDKDPRLTGGAAPFHAYWAIVLGSITIFVLGRLLSPAIGQQQPTERQ